MVCRIERRVLEESLKGQIIDWPRNSGRVCCVPKGLCQRLDLERVPAQDHRALCGQAPGLSPWPGGCAPASIEDPGLPRHGGCAPDVQFEFNCTIKSHGGCAPDVQMHD